MDKNKNERIQVLPPYKSGVDKRSLALLGLLLAMFIAQLLVSKSITSSKEAFTNYVIQMVLGVTSLGFMASGALLTYVSGKRDLSLGSLMTLSAVVTCTLTIQMQKYSPWLAALVCVTVPILLGVLCGAINGFFVGWLDINSFIATLATSYVFYAAMVLYNGGHVVVGQSVPVYDFIGKGRIFGIPVSILLMIASFLIFGFILNRTVFGRYIYAVGGNGTACRYSGIDPRKITFITYVIGGMMAGFAGMFISAYAGNIDSSVGAEKEFDVIVAVVLGGSQMRGGEGSMLGTFLGVLMLGMLTFFYVQFNISQAMQWVIRALLFIGIVLLNNHFGKERSVKQSDDQ